MIIRKRKEGVVGVLLGSTQNNSKETERKKRDKKFSRNQTRIAQWYIELKIVVARQPFLGNRIVLTGGEKGENRERTVKD